MSSILKLEDIVGNEYLKRAIEVAFSGNHSMAIIDTFGSNAGEFYEWATNIEFQNKWIKLLVHPICPCKCYSSGIYECKCELNDLKCHFATLTNMLNDYDIIVECCKPMSYEYVANAIGNNEK